MNIFTIKTSIFMKPSEFEQLVCERFRDRGYRAEVSAASGDYGVDVFAQKK